MYSNSKFRIFLNKILKYSNRMRLKFSEIFKQRIRIHSKTLKFICNFIISEYIRKFRILNKPLNEQIGALGSENIILMN